MASRAPPCRCTLRAAWADSIDAATPCPAQLLTQLPSRFLYMLCFALQVDFLKLLYDKLLELHLKHADTPEERHFPRPSFKVRTRCSTSVSPRCCAQL